MSCLSFPPDMTVQQALAAAGGLSKVFTGHRTACVGCYLARFCTLSDVAKTYGLALDDFTAELEQAALADPLYTTGAIHE